MTSAQHTYKPLPNLAWSERREGGNPLCPASYRRCVGVWACLGISESVSKRLARSARGAQKRNNPQKLTRMSYFQKSRSRRERERERDGRCEEEEEEMPLRFCSTYREPTNPQQTCMLLSPNDTTPYEHWISSSDPLIHDVYDYKRKRSTPIRTSDIHSNNSIGLAF